MEERPMASGCYEKVHFVKLGQKKSAAKSYRLQIEAGRTEDLQDYMLRKPVWIG